MAQPVSGAPDKVKTYHGEPVVKVADGEGRCTGCGRFLGTVTGNRNLQCGEVVLVSRSPVRCRSCSMRQIWLPLVT